MIETYVICKYNDLDYNTITCLHSNNIIIIKRTNILNFYFYFLFFKKRDCRVNPSNFVFDLDNLTD